MVIPNKGFGLRVDTKVIIATAIIQQENIFVQLVNKLMVECFVDWDYIQVSLKANFMIDHYLAYGHLPLLYALLPQQKGFLLEVLHRFSSILELFLP